MCRFFSFVTEPEGHPNERFYFNWKQRRKDINGVDSHDHIISHYKLVDSKCNSYEYNPLIKEFAIDQQNSETDDRVQAEEWVENLNFRKIIKPLVIKPIINPLEDCKKISEPTQDHIQLLREWASVYDLASNSVWAMVRASVSDSVYNSVGASVWASVYNSVGASVWASICDSVGASVGDLVEASVRAYISSFFTIRYKYDFSSCIKLWEQGLVPSFDGQTWRLHSGKDADVVYEISKEELEREE